MIKFFDSAAHPTLTGNWTFNKQMKKKKATFKKLNSEMKKNKYSKACAIGLDGYEKYNHFQYIKECKKFNNLVPIAGFNPNKKKKRIYKELNLIKNLGYRGIKLHPRISNFTLDHPNLSYILQLAEKKKLIVLLCCYVGSGYNEYSAKDFLSSLVNLFKNRRSLKTVLLHGGCQRLLDFSEFVRLRPKNFLLDLSMTIMRYKGSSVDLDIKYLFKTLDQRVCIGSDFPEHNLKDVKKRFLDLSKGISKSKKENIAFKNLNNFFN